MKKSFYGLFLSCLMVVQAVAAPRFEADVAVDVTAETVSAAKKQAMAQALRKGLAEVVSGVSTEKGVTEIDKLTDAQQQHFVRGVMVLMEKSSDVRYIADLRVSINEDILRAYMAENDLPFIAGEEQNVLAVPLLEKADGSYELWGEDNFWRQAFLERKGLKKGNLNIVNIEKNLGNLTAVEASRFFEMSDKEYQELAEFNQVTEIYVLKYSLKDGKVYVKRFPLGDVFEEEIGNKTLKQVIDSVLVYFKDAGKERRIVSEAAVEERMEVVYNYPKLSAWMGLKKILEDNSQVGKIKVISMANGKVHFNFMFSGVLEKLQADLGIHGYQLKQEGEHYAVY